MDCRLLFIHVESRAGDGSSLESLDQCTLIDDRTTSGIDKEGGRFHAGQFTGPDQMMRGRCERYMNRQDIRLPKEIL